MDSILVAEDERASGEYLKLLLEELGYAVRLTGNGVEDLEGRGFIFPSAIVLPGDILAAAGLSLALSWFITSIAASTPQSV